MKYAYFLSKLSAKPIFQREYAYFGLKKLRANGERKDDRTGLSQEVRIITQNFDDLSYSEEISVVDYDDRFWRAIAFRMSMGIAPHHPAMIIVSKTIHSSQWQVVVAYKDMSSSLVLWRQVERPEWLDRVLRVP